MRITYCGLGAAIAILPCLCFLAAGQEKGASQVSKEVLAMRQKADINARALATVVQGRAVRTGAYAYPMNLYAKDLGGQYPINPCTGTRTGYTMTIGDKGKTAAVAAIMGNKCGKWNPKIYRLKL